MKLWVKKTCIFFFCSFFHPNYYLKVLYNVAKQNFPGCSLHVLLWCMIVRQFDLMEEKNQTVCQILQEILFVKIMF